MNNEYIVKYRLNNKRSKEEVRVGLVGAKTANEALDHIIQSYQGDTIILIDIHKI